MNFEQEIREQVTLQWQRFIARVPISAGMYFENPQIMDAMLATSMHELVTSLEVLVLGKQLPDKTVTASEPIFFEYPASPFQHWKYKHQFSWWLKWFINWRPIINAQKVKIASLEATWTMQQVYPDQTITDPRLGDPYVVINQPRQRYWTTPDDDSV